MEVPRLTGRENSTVKIKKVGIFRLILRILLIVGTAYIMLLLIQIYSNAYTTEVVISYTMSESFESQGVACFTAVNIEGTGKLGYLVQSGERVSSGTQVAEIYTDEDQANCREELEDIDSKINLLERSQNAGGTELSVLTNDMQAALYDLLDAMDTGRYEDMKTGEQSYLLAANRMQVSTGQNVDFSDTLADLESQREQVLMRLGSPEGIYAPDNGYFVSGKSASYLSCDEETLQSATPSELQSMLRNGLETDGSGYVGKIITSYHWNYYGICTLEQANELEQLSSVTVRFPGRAEEALPALVSEIVKDEDNDIAKFSLSCEYTGSEVLGLGQQAIEIELKTYTGLRVPTASLHIVDDAKGVYIKYGNLAKFRKIESIYQDSEYILVPNPDKMTSEEAAAAISEIRLYDEVIVQGKGLYNNKLLS